MKNLLFFLLPAITLFLSCQNRQGDPDYLLPENAELLAKDPGALLVKESVDAMGGMEQYRKLRDVEYTYTYRDAASGKQDVSLERYLYNGELSWARYTEHNNALLPDRPGEIMQGYNGDTTWMTLNGKLVDDPKLLRRADFLRKTNFYWFNMMFKLLDPGVRFEKMESQSVNGTDYEVVRVTFGEDIGDVQDIYQLYVHPETKMIDQFLFTVMDFGRSDPLLMKVQYEEANGLKWPAYRKYAPSNWQAEVADSLTWTEEISSDLKFNTGIDPSIFQIPEPGNNH